MFQTTPPAYAATVGAVFNAALQLGAAVGSAIIASIEVNIDKRSPGSFYAGRRAGFWFVFAVVTVMTIAITFLYRVPKPEPPADGQVTGKEV